MASIAAQKRAVGIYQTKLGSAADKCGQDCADFLKKHKLDPRFTQQDLSDGLKSILLGYSAIMGNPMLTVILATLDSILPSNATSITFQRSDNEMKAIGDSVARALESGRPSEVKEIMRSALIEHIQDQVENTKQHYVNPTGNKAYRTKKSGEEDLYYKDSPREGYERVWERVLEPGACEWCRSVYQTSPYNWGFPRHNGCRCSRILRIKKVSI